MASQEFLGIDPSQVKSSITMIEANYKTAMYVLTEKNQAEFIDVMANIWASEQAVEFFTAYKNDIALLVADIKRVFDSVLDSMNTAAKNLTSLAGTKWSIDSPVESIKEISVANIKPDIDGVKGIDVTQARNTLTILDDISRTLENTLGSTKVNVEISGFKGGSMESNLINSVLRMKDQVMTAFNNIKLAAQSAIQETTDMYSSTSEQIATAFSGGQSA